MSTKPTPSSVFIRRGTECVEEPVPSEGIKPQARKRRLGTGGNGETYWDRVCDIANGVGPKATPIEALVLARALLRVLASDEEQDE